MNTRDKIPHVFFDVIGCIGNKSFQCVLDLLFAMFGKILNGRRDGVDRTFLVAYQFKLALVG